MIGKDNKGLDGFVKGEKGEKKGWTCKAIADGIWLGSDNEFYTVNRMGEMIPIRILTVKDCEALDVKWDTVKHYQIEQKAGRTQTTQQEAAPAVIVPAPVSAPGASIMPVGMTIVRPVVSAKEAVQAWNDYIELTKAILTDDDYYRTKNGKMAKKKSAWRKYARFFSLTVLKESVTTNIREDADGRVIKAEVILEIQAPSGQRMPGTGICSLFERGHKEDKLNDKGQVSCKGPCDGRKHFNNPEHDIPATAYTRAMNRATADIIGSGETSAEELSED
jgi:hypothetical protein